MKKYVYSFLLIIILLGFGYIFLKGYFYNEEIDAYKQQTVCKYVFCEKFPKTTRSFFVYYVNNQLYKTSYGGCPENYEQKIGGFYIMYYSAKDANKIKVNFSQQVIDTTAIINSGFKKEDIK